MSRVKHPNQPLVIDANGVVRFKANAIVELLFEENLLDLNRMASLVHRGKIPVADLIQIDQLLGYSVSGFGDLSHVPRRLAGEMDEEAAKMSARRTKRSTKKKP